MDTDLIREALTLQAERAPDSREVYRTLRLRVAEQDRRRRRTRIALVAVGAATAVAVAPFVSSVHWHRDTTTVAPAAGGGGGDVSTTELPRDFPLLFRPTWLPAGLHEASAQTKFDKSFASRTYVSGNANPADPRAGTLTVSIDSDEPLGDFGALSLPLRPEDVTTGQLESPRSAWLNWTPVSGVEVDILATNLVLTDADLEHIAGALVADDTRRNLPLRVNWWPDGATPNGATVPVVASRSATTVSADGLEVTLAPGAFDATGESLTVGTTPARLHRLDDGVLVLELAHGKGQLLRLTANKPPNPARPRITEVDLIRVAQSLQIERR
jgi:hypothetical protein